MPRKPDRLAGLVGRVNGLGRCRGLASIVPGAGGLAPLDDAVEELSELHLEPIALVV